MNRSNRIVINLIYKSLRLVMATIPMLMLLIQPAVAIGLDDKDNKDKRVPPSSNSRTIDSGNKPDTPRFNPPPRQTPSDSSPKLERANRNESPRAPRFDPLSQANTSAPPIV